MRWRHISKIVNVVVACTRDAKVRPRCIITMKEKWGDSTEGRRERWNVTDSKARTKNQVDQRLEIPQRGAVRRQIREERQRTDVNDSDMVPLAVIDIEHEYACGRLPVLRNEACRERTVEWEAGPMLRVLARGPK